uniref:Transposase Tc1-like domain-containing protein n=1 Tax=Dicentrarchus labrax TaxID=13489 RepID=A0A8P4KTC8_DICLA
HPKKTISSPSQSPAMTALHRQARLRWCRQHVHWNPKMWRNVMSSDESRFCLRQLDPRVKVWRKHGERYADCSVMVWGGISLTGKTRLVIIGETSLSPSWGGICVILKLGSSTRGLGV